MLLKLLGNIDRKKFDILLVSLRSGGELRPAFESIHVPVHELGIGSGRSVWAALSRLRCLMNAYKPDVVHTWMYHADLIGGGMARLLGFRNIIWGLRQSNFGHGGHHKRSTLLVVKLCALLSGWIPKVISSCSEEACRVHRALGYKRDHFVVIPNGFDLTNFQPVPHAKESLRRLCGFPSSFRLIGMVGRFHEQKNFPGFIEAARIVAKRYPDVGFVMVGKNVERSNFRLTQWIGSTGFGARFVLLGLRKDMPDIMAGLDLLVLPSVYGEAFPNVVGEAMACGVPCVVTDVGDAAYIVGNSGWVAESFSAADIAARMDAFLQLPGQRSIRLGKAARRRVSELFEIRAVVNQYEKLYCRFA